MQPVKVPMADMDAMPVATILERIGAELGNLADQVDNLQDSLGPLLMEAAKDQPHAMVDIQALDSIAQTLSNLSSFVGGMSRSGLDTHTIAILPLADRVTLADLADRLRGHGPGDGDEDFELF